MNGISQFTQSANNLNSTLSTMNYAREKFDTVQDCEPAIQRLLRGAQGAERTQGLETVSWWVARQALELLPPQSLGWEDWEALKGGRLLELAWLG